jgi:hypothetical protein
MTFILVVGGKGMANGTGNGACTAPRNASIAPGEAL